MDFNKLFETDIIKLADQKEGKTLHINVIKTIKTQYGDSFLLYDKKHNKTFFSNNLLKAYLTKMLGDLTNEKNYYYIDADLSTILSFKILSIKNVNGKNQVQLDFIKNKKSQCNNEILDLSDSDKSDEKEILKTVKKTFRKF